MVPVVVCVLSRISFFKLINRLPKQLLLMTQFKLLQTDFGWDLPLI